MLTRTSTIDQVEKAFAIWRDNKNGKYTIPDKLWNKVKVLIGTQGASPVLKRLGISWKQARMNGVIPSSVATVKNKKKGTISPFIKIPQALPIKCERKSQLTFQRGDTLLSLNDPSNEQIQLFIDMLR